MTNRIKMMLLTLVMFSFGALNAQEDMQKTGISDDMTINAEQNKNWRMGQTAYSAKPKNAWELGVHAGHFLIDGEKK